MKLKLLTSILVVGGLGYFLYKKIKQPKEVISIKKLDEHDYVIYFDDNEISLEEKFV